MDGEWNYTLSEELSKRLAEMSTLEIGSKEYEAAVKAFVPLYDLGLKEAKAYDEFQTSESKRKLEADMAEFEKDSKENEMIIKAYDSGIQALRVAAEVGLGVASLLTYAHFTKKGFILEREGTYTSYTLKEVLRNLASRVRR